LQWAARWVCIEVIVLAHGMVLLDTVPLCRRTLCGHAPGDLEPIWCGGL